MARAARSRTSEQPAADESAAEAPGSAGPGRAEVSRDRALYFATGQRPAPAAAAVAAPAPAESWPGYFNTARDLDANRLAAQAARQEDLLRKEQLEKKDEDMIEPWQPRKKPRTSIMTSEYTVPRLQDLALECLANHCDLLPGLEYVDDATRHRLATAIVKKRRMNANLLPLFIFPGVREIEIPDCSTIDESSFLQALKDCLDKGLSLTTLRLGLCGRSVTDTVILELGDALRCVENLQVHGCYRLSDVGCEALVRRCAPSLQSLEISCNQRITKTSIDYFGELKELTSLTLSECPQLDDACLESLVSMTKLRCISLQQMERLTDEFIYTLAQSLPDLEEISLARCSQLTDASIRMVLETCRGLKVLDLSDLHLITDKSFEPIRMFGHALRRVNLRGCIGLTDNAIQDVAEGAGHYLEHLVIASVSQSTDATIQALQQHCASSLRTLDISFCRLVSEDSLGRFTDSSECLSKLVLWGCTQITARFITGHSRDGLFVTGHPLLTGLTVRS